MQARDILSKNVRALIDEAKESRTPLGTIKSVAERSKESGGHLTNGTVGRMATGESPVNIDAVGDLAAVFGLQPWQLLVENLNPKALPRLADAALLSQIKQIVDSVPAVTPDFSPSLTDEQAVQRPERSPKVGPALKQAFAQGTDKNAGRRSAPATKQGGRSRR